MKMTKDQILETQFVQRAYDGHWEKVVRVKDYENSYTYTDEQRQNVTFVPDKWMTTAVYPFIMEEVS